MEDSHPDVMKRSVSKTALEFANTTTSVYSSIPLGMGREGIGIRFGAETGMGINVQTIYVRP